MRPRPGWLKLCALVCLMYAGQAPAQEEGTLRVILSREAPAAYVPGEPLSIRVNIQGEGDGALMALGLYETLPEGWQFLGAGAGPAILPAPGQTDVLQFGWVTPPPLPFSLTYEVQVPAEDRGKRVLSGQVEFRLMGGRQVSAPALTEIEGPGAEVPQIQLKGANPISLPEGTSYSEPGYSAVDDKDGDLTASVRVEGAVDTQQPGSYTLTYSVSDSEGNVAKPVHRTIVVAAAVEEQGPKDASGGVVAGQGSPAPEPASRPARAPQSISGVMQGLTPEQARALREQETPKQLHPPLPRTAGSAAETGGSPPGRPVAFSREGKGNSAARISSGQPLPPGYARDVFTTTGVHAAPLAGHEAEGAGGLYANSPVRMETARARTPISLRLLLLAGAVGVAILAAAILLWRYAYNTPAWRRKTGGKGRHS